jgi:hypothetical protein
VNERQAALGWTPTALPDFEGRCLNKTILTDIKNKVKTLIPYFINHTVDFSIYENAVNAASKTWTVNKINEITGFGGITFENPDMSVAAFNEHAKRLYQTINLLRAVHIGSVTSYKTTKTKSCNVHYGHSYGGHDESATYTVVGHWHEPVWIDTSYWQYWEEYFNEEYGFWDYRYIDPPIWIEDGYWTARTWQTTEYVNFRTPSYPGDIWNGWDNIPATPPADDTQAWVALGQQYWAMAQFDSDANITFSETWGTLQNISTASTTVYWDNPPSAANVGAYASKKYDVFKFKLRKPDKRFYVYPNYNDYRYLPYIIASASISASIWQTKLETTTDGITTTDNTKTILSALSDTADVVIPGLITTDAAWTAETSTPYPGSFTIEAPQIKQTFETTILPTTLNFAFKDW